MAKNKTPKTLDEIWLGDQLDRRAEADLLTAYIECVAARNVTREDMRAYTIAIDADYGVGKTFFLRRFKEHLEMVHPVAFVDAWSDDLADEPLTALAATLRDALSQSISKSHKVKAKWDRFLKASGDVAKLATQGLIRRGVGLLVTTAVAEQLEEVVVGIAEETAASAALAAGDVAADATEKALSLKPAELMHSRIAAFEAGQAAIREMKDSLRALVSALSKTGQISPIIIIIDELDRCRPTYAIKLLEEIKHLFDVQGLVFVLGMNAKQLQFSVRAAYGAEFDGGAYLRRFISRQYRLRSPDLRGFVGQLLREHGISEHRLAFPEVYLNGQPQPPVAELIAIYLDAYEGNARDAIQVIDRLQTCLALTGTAPLIMAYLLPLIIGELRGQERGSLPEVAKPNRLFFVHFDAGNRHSVGLGQLSAAIEIAAKLPIDDLSTKFRRGKISLPEEQIFHGLDQSRLLSEPLASPGRYLELLDAVGRFSVVS